MKSKKLIAVIASLMLIGSQLAVLPAVAVEMPAARSYTNELGDVFLGGDYIEIGLQKGGSFGSAGVANSSFTPVNVEYPNCIGFSIDKDGFGVGNAPETGDFFLPGSPYECYSFSYTTSSGTSRVWASEKNNSDKYYWLEAIQAPTTTDTSDLSTGQLSATTVGITKDNIKLTQVISFGKEDKFIKVTVTAENLTADKTFTDLIYMREVDPDQDQDTQDTYDTLNKVICNPSTTYTDDMMALVMAVGPVTLQPLCYLSFEKDARAAYQTEYITDDSSLPTTADESLYTPAENTADGYTALGFDNDDDYIAMYLKMDNIAPGESTTRTMFISLDPDITNVIKAAKGEVPEVAETDQTTITIKTKPGEEYSIDGGKTWQTSGVFTGLKAGTEYEIISRIAATDDKEAGEPSDPLKITTETSDAPEVPELLTKTDTTITIATVDGLEYSIDGGDTWQTSGVFTGLDADTDYTILSRVAATDDSIAGKISEGFTVHTKIAGATAPVAPEVISSTSDTIVIKAVDGQEYSIDGGETWQTSGEFTGLEKGETYSIITRIAATEDTAASEISEATEVVAEDNDSSSESEISSESESSSNSSSSSKSDSSSNSSKADASNSSTNPSTGVGKGLLPMALFGAVAVILKKKKNK